MSFLSAFDFDAYRIRVITVEHNFTPVREKLTTPAGVSRLRTQTGSGFSRR